MDCEFKVKGNRLVIGVPKELDHHVAMQIQEEADLLIETYRIQCVVFDFQNTEFMDSSGIGVILGRCRSLSFSGGKVLAIHLRQERVKKLFAMAGLHKLVEVIADDE